MVTEGKEADRLEADIECLNPANLSATLVSNVGNHCSVWRSNKPNTDAVERASYIEFVIKVPLSHHTDSEIRMLARQYRMLQKRLDEIIPEALFIITRVNGHRSVCVLARAANIWFNLANPQNREEAIALLSNSSRAFDQLNRFLETARELRDSANPRLIDLYGLDNLVLDTNREIRYIDSFDVFFFEDMQHLFGEKDLELEKKISISLERLGYLERIHASAAHNRKAAKEEQSHSADFIQRSSAEIENDSTVSPTERAQQDRQR